MLYINPTKINKQNRSGKLINKRKTYLATEKLLTNKEKQKETEEVI